MVCIAAFIILALIGGAVAIISIFRPKVGKAYWKIFKKAWGCLAKKVRLQKCETNFKSDVKNTLLSRVVIKHPKWVKPLSAIIEVLSVIIVIVAVWAILTAIKSLLALWTLGTCNVTKPEACTMGAEVCSIDEAEPENLIESTGRWFTEWGEIFAAIPDKFHEYKAEDYNFNYILANPDVADKPIAVDIFDPGCLVCANSYKNQKQSGFFENYTVRLVPFAIQDQSGNYKFKNSNTVVRYMFAAEQFKGGVAMKIIDKIFTAKNNEGISYQNKFNEDYSEEEAALRLEQWLTEFGLDNGQIEEIRTISTYPEISTKIQENQSIVTDQLKVKGIPTMIYDGRKYTGLHKM